MKTKSLIVKFGIILALLVCKISVHAQSTPSSGSLASINGFTLGTTTNALSGGSNTQIQGYSDFTNIHFNLKEAGVYPVRMVFVNTGLLNPAHSIYQHVKIWIDYNNDNQFDPSEFVPFQQSTNLSNFNLNTHGYFANEMNDYISIPTGTTGTHNLRVRYLNNTTAFLPDADYTDDGETEDYQVTISSQACFAPAPLANSIGYVDADVTSTDTAFLYNNPMNLSINFYNNTFTCGYVQWYYSLGNGIPYALIEIPNSDNASISFSPPDTGFIWLRASGLISASESFFFTRGTCFYVSPCDSCGYHQSGNTDSTDTSGVKPNGPFISTLMPKNNVVAEATGIVLDPESETKTEIYPNPFSDRLHLKGFDSNSAISVTLFDVNGQKVCEKFQSNSAIENTDLELNLSMLAPGIYFIRMNSGKGQSIKKMVKAER